MIPLHDTIVGMNNLSYFNKHQNNYEELFITLKKDFTIIC